MLPSIAKLIQYGLNLYLLTKRREKESLVTPKLTVFGGNNARAIKND